MASAEKDVHVTPLTVGARLQMAREAAGWSIEQVALKLRLSQAQIAALESGRRDDLPPAPYVRGYIRNYARLLGIEVEDVAYKPHIEIPTSSPPRMGVSPLIRQVNVVGPATYALAVVILVFLGLWWHERGSHENKIAKRPVSLVANAHTGLPPRLQSLTMPGTSNGQLSRFPLNKPKIASTGAAEDMSRLSSHGQQNAAGLKRYNQRSAQGGAVPNQAGLVSLPIGHSTAVLQVHATSGPCWISIHDATGARLAYELMQKGESIRVVGAPPYDVSFGNPVGVNVRLNGRLIQLPAAEQGQVMRITIRSKSG